MQSTRIEKIARLLQEELSEIFRLEPAKTTGVLVSVSAVRVSADLSIARGYLSVFPGDKANAIVNNISANAKSVRYDLAQRVRYQLRKVPELNFYVDDSLDYIQHIDDLLASDPIKHASADDPEA